MMERLPKSKNPPDSRDVKSDCTFCAVRSWINTVRRMDWNVNLVNKLTVKYLQPVLRQKTSYVSVLYNNTYKNYDKWYMRH